MVLVLTDKQKDKGWDPGTKDPDNSQGQFKRTETKEAGDVAQQA
jgi:hypothetical protein